MDEHNRSGPSNVYSSFTSRISGCQGCKQRKEKLTSMLSSHHFWIGVVVGVGGVYVYHRVTGK